jgi:quaternary ammonium compound-resistance protein SugE
MAWVVLFIAGLFEIGWAVGLKCTEGFTRPGPTVGTGAALIVSMFLLGSAVRTLPLGTAYAVWTGIGTVGTALLGVVLFREPATAMRLFCIGLIVAGIIGLRMAPGHSPQPFRRADQSRSGVHSGALRAGWGWSRGRRSGVFHLGHLGG